MNQEHRSSEPEELNELALSVLMACHHRGPLALSELDRLLGCSGEASVTAILEVHLLPEGLLEAQGDRFAATQKGREYLDQILEGIESHLTPDAPEHVQRYRRASPTLPFDTTTIWSDAIAVNFRAQPEALRPLVPEVFDLDLYEGHAFVSLTASRLKDFGFGWLPRALRINFYQATYRAHVSFTDFQGRKRRGCYFVRSETNSAMMSMAANLLPEFRGHRCQTYPILMARQGSHLMLTVDSEDDPSGKVVLVLDETGSEKKMPLSSCFRDVESAYQHLVDFYDAFAYEPETNEVLLLQIERGDWDIQVVEPVDYYFGYFNNGPFPPGTTELDSVFYFRNVPYRWLPLLKERLKPRSP